MGVLGLNRFVRSIFAVFVSVLIIILAFAAILYFKGLGKFIEESKFKLIPTKLCAGANNDLVNMILVKNLAWLDFLKPKDEQKGLMGCYCFNKL